MNPECPYCGKESVHLPDSEVYKRSYGGYAYVCIPCDAFVGCHKCGDNSKAKGSLANKELRNLRVKAHGLFDPLWLHVWKSGRMKKKRAREAAYRWLASELNITRDDCHIGMMRDDDVKRVIEVCEKVYKKARDHAA